MVKRKIVWSNRANIKLFEILDFYKKRNKSTTFSKKLFKKFVSEISLLVEQPELGVKTDIDNVRGLIVDNFILYYEIYTDLIVIHTVWDCRQNPESLKIK